MIRSALSYRMLMFAALVVAFCASAFAQNAAKGTTTEGTALAAGQKVAIDAKTGRLRQPTPEESRKLAAAMQKFINHSTDGLTVVQHGNGMKSVDLQGRFQSAAVARKNADGSVTERCVTNESEAANFAKGTATKAAPAQKEKR